MIDYRPTALWQEKTSSEQYRNRALEHFRKMVSRYHGGYWAGARDADGYPDNHYFEFLSQSVPRWVFNNPKARVKGAAMGPRAAQTVEAEGKGLNRWIHDAEFSKDLDTVAYDYGMMFGVLALEEKERPGFEEASPPPFRPSCVRISQEDFVFDHGAKDPNTVRWAAHRVVRDIDDLKAEARRDKSWDAAAIDRLTNREDQNYSYEGVQDTKQVPERHQIAYWEFWVPELQEDDIEYFGKGVMPEGDDERPEREPRDLKDKGQRVFNGVILTIPENPTGNEGFLRKPRDFYGPRWGPYYIFQCYYIPNEPMGLSPLMAVEEQIADVNAHARALRTSAANRKRIALFDGLQRGDAERIQNAQDGTSVMVRGLDTKKYVEAELGGVTEGGVAGYGIAKDRLDRVSGFDDAQKGMANERATATASAIADSKSELRGAYQGKKFRDMVANVLKGVLWYLHHDDRVVFPLSVEDAEELGSPTGEAWFQGGLDDEQPIPFDDLEVEIEPYSMERTSETVLARRAAEVVGFVLQVAPTIPMTPFVDWKRVLQIVGESVNMPDLGDIIDLDEAAAVAAQMQGQGGPAPLQPGAHAGSMGPRLAGDVSGGQAQNPGSGRQFGYLPGGRSGGGAGQFGSVGLQGNESGAFARTGTA